MAPTPLEVVLATTNKKKLIEIKALLQGLVHFRNLEAFPGMPAVAEDADTFEGNALLKARAVFAYTKKNALADDSGLAVDALGGRPGVYSARYAGPGHRDRDNLNKVLEELKSVADPKRTARFQCAVAYVGHDSHGNHMERTFAGACEGRIIHAPRGNSGFGYDPIFLVPEYDKTFAELGLDIKNQISHRAHALKLFQEFFEREFL